MSINYATSKKTLLRLITLLLVGSVMLLCSSCSDNVPEKENASALSSEAEENNSGSGKTETFTTGDTAVLDTLKITANELKELKSDESGFISAEEGKVFTGVNFTVENISDESQTVSSILLFEASKKDRSSVWQIWELQRIPLRSSRNMSSPFRSGSGRIFWWIPACWRRLSRQRG